MKQLTKFAGLIAASYIFLTGQNVEAASPEEFNRKMAVGVNLGNCLEAPNEGDWG